SFPTIRRTPSHTLFPYTTLFRSVAVVRRPDRDHGAQGRRLAGRDLQSGEAAPGEPDHPDLAGAPRLRGQPIDHRERVVLLALQVDRKSTRLNSSHDQNSYAVFCL